MITPFLTFVAFILLLFVSLSVPIIKSIYLFKLGVNVASSVVTSASGSVKFGVWGYCVSPINVAVAGISRSVSGECSSTRLGYTFDESIESALRVSGFNNVIKKGLTTVLVLHPIACLLAFVAFLTSLFMLRRGRNGTSRLPSLCTAGVAFLALLVTLIVFILDIVLVVVVRAKVLDQGAQLKFSWGNAVWMVLGALIALILANLGACIGICTGNHRRTTRKAVY
jgi:hypothetical protein